MARAPDERITQAKAMYLKGMKLVEIASQLNLPEGTVRRWKSTHKWDGERSCKNSERPKRKRGAQPGNKNATGPPGNKNAEKHGLFSRYLPRETISIIEEMPEDSLDILWHQIQLAYAAIIRAQKIMHVKNQEDKVIEKVGKSDGTVTGEKWEVQQAWDRQASFLAAQARAQKTLEGMISRYEELLHKHWELATEEQKARVSLLKSKVDADKDQPVQITFKKASEQHGRD